MNKKQSAFTIIEVVLVLAVAGLIFLVVFAAVPRLQASRRDNQRKRDAETLSALIIEFEANVGRLPTAAEVRDGFLGVANTAFLPYVEDENFQDPSGSDYVRLAHATTPIEGQFNYDPGYGCNTNNTDTISTSPVNGSILMGLERGVYCVGGS